MKIVNKTKKTVLFEDALSATSFLDRSLGLLNPHAPRALVLSTRFGIHTFAMRETIDVLILNDFGKIVKIKQRLTPNSVFLWKPKYSKVIELPSGTIMRTKTEIGDVLALS